MASWGVDSALTHRGGVLPKAKAETPSRKVILHLLIYYDIYKVILDHLIMNIWCYRFGYCSVRRASWALA